MLKSVIVLGAFFLVAQGYAQESLDCKNPRSQSEINECTYLKFEEAENGNKGVYDHILKLLVQSIKEAEHSDDAHELERTMLLQNSLIKGQAAWLTVREHTCDAYAGFSRQLAGSVYPADLNSCKEEATLLRTKELKKIYPN